MCGVCGYIGNMPAEKFEEMLRKNETRGGHAWGWAYLDEKEQRFFYHKQPGRFSQANVTAPKSRLIIAHTRFATHGKPEKNENNHPHINTALGVMMVHNGVVTNTHKKQETECDSEAILKIMIDQMSERKHPDMMEVLRKTAEKIDGSFRLGVLHTESPDLWVVCDGGDPVYFGFHEEYICFASEEKDIPDECAKMHALGNRVYKVTPNLRLAAKRFEKKQTWSRVEWRDFKIDYHERIEDKWVQTYCKKCKNKLYGKRSPTIKKKLEWCYVCRDWVEGMTSCDDCEGKEKAENCHTCAIFQEAIRNG